MHAPAHIRKAFLELLEGVEIPGEVLFDNEDAQEQWDRMGVEGQLQALAGWVWHSTDIMPDHSCEELDIPSGSDATGVIILFGFITVLVLLGVGGYFVSRTDAFRACLVMVRVNLLAFWRIHKTYRQTGS
jgi:hypothetical protein